MQATLETIETLNDLIQINNDRIAGYEKALEDLKAEDSDLKALFSSMISESHEIRLALGTEVNVLGGDMDHSTTTAGKIYRAWMDVKAVFTGRTRESILANCEAGEDAAQRAYRMALDEEELPAYLREMISEQQMTLKASHDQIKALRDANR
ncbi:PA2169 family four-helix-bundle protein [Chitinophaga tropicalis]|uniref:PA2169 family four-helix-bundle protein n=1 Tax=Chitinophaga tropicalis TaxID=2683588 RepID=A0A7K1UAK7_9BACT|nr:PA2169 family four-helix-bundle protein [Chitinophaga tropicalis]MVT11310.1 PA2169 family four-helix-bundle protein [Chitinophaga tropicalis]